MAKKQPLELDERKATAGLLALAAEERETRIDDKHEPRKTEAVLNGAGLTASEIGALMGKNPDAVAKAISRSRQPKKRSKKRGR
jgi:hypothetical protein